MGNGEGSGSGAGQTKCRSYQVGKRNGCENAAVVAARHEAQCTRINGCANEPATHRRARRAVQARYTASFITVSLRSRLGGYLGSFKLLPVSLLRIRRLFVQSQTAPPCPHPTACTPRLPRARVPPGHLWQCHRVLS